MIIGIGFWYNFWGNKNVVEMRCFGVFEGTREGLCEGENIENLTFPLYFWLCLRHVMSCNLQLLR